MLCTSSARDSQQDDLVSAVRSCPVKLPLSVMLCVWLPLVVMLCQLFAVQGQQQQLVTGLCCAPAA